MTLGLFNSFFDFVVSKKIVILIGGGGQMLQKIESQELLGLCYFVGGPMLKKIEFKNFLDSVV